MTSVALVVLDTLRKDYFDEYFEWLPGLQYEQAFSTANWTAPAHGSLFTGRYPSEIRIHAKSPSLTESCTPLPELLQSHGVTTRCWTANPNLSRELGWNRGFNEFIDAHVFRTGDKNALNWAKFSDKHVEESAFKYLKAAFQSIFGDYNTIASLRHGYLSKASDGRLNLVADQGAQAILGRAKETEFGDEEFLFINLMEAHGYDPPVEYGDFDVEVSILDSLRSKSNSDEAVRAYDAAVTHLSDVYRELFETIELDFEYIITLADHGEMLGEHGIWGHTYGLYPEVTHVPLVVSGPDRSGETDEVMSLIDVHQTILDIFDLQEGSRGRNMMQVDSDSPSERFVEYHGLVPTARERLEEADVRPEDIEAFERSLVGVVAPPDYYGFQSRDGLVEVGFHENGNKKIMEWQKQVHVPPSESANRELSEQTKERLKDLGYK